MWQIKVFRTREKMEEFLNRHSGDIQYHEIFVNNAYGIEYRKLRII